MGGIRHRTAFGRTPVKGSLMRRMLKMMMRPEGASSFELIEVGLKLYLVGHYVGVLRNEKGWDVRAFPCPPPSASLVDARYEAGLRLQSRW